MTTRLVHVTKGCGALLEKNARGSFSFSVSLDSFIYNLNLRQHDSRKGKRVGRGWRLKEGGWRLKEGRVLGHRPKKSITNSSIPVPYFDTVGFLRACPKQ